MKSMTVEAKREKLEEVTAFVTSELEQFDCSPKVQMQMELAIEEVFVNIASYAYAPGTGDAEIRVETLEDPLRISVTFIDSGVQFDPLARPDADISPEALQSRIGGLGIFMVKKYMDDVAYVYDKLSEILEKDRNELEAVLKDNFLRFFKKALI